ncbi:NUDIX domain-containing protein [Halobacteria archaeon AArc-dxtr1]|nr:NUDIX domain-containing protein [Halobacteria archaeon AArc-dxtr1]
MSDDGDAHALEETHVVTAFLRNRGEVLLARRSDAVGTYRGRWGGVSGFAEGDPDEQVLAEIEEETGLGEAANLVRSGRPIRVTDDELGREWVVHPYLFDCATREVALSEEHDAAEWGSPTAILDPADDRETVPGLWTAYERIAPTVRTIAADDERGAAALSIAALQVIRDRAGLLLAERADSGASPADEREELAALARQLLEARPAMAVMRNRVNRAMADALGDEEPGEDTSTDDPTARGARAVHQAALVGIDRALTADDDAAATAAERIDGRVATLSRSGTVLAAIREGEPARVFVAESRPADEGVAVAEELAGDGPPVTLHTDAAVAHVLATESVDRVVVGADAIRSDGAVVNKAGTRALAIAAAREGVSVSVVAATDKITPREELSLESGPQNAVYDGNATVDVLNPTFDVTPTDCVTEYLTERGALDVDGVAAVADELRSLESWTERID